MNRTRFLGEEVKFNENITCFQQLLNARGEDFAHMARAQKPDNVCTQDICSEYNPDDLWCEFDPRYLVDESVAEFELLENKSEVGNV